jgi:serine palmitoyltransferase
MDSLGLTWEFGLDPTNWLSGAFLPWYHKTFGPVVSAVLSADGARLKTALGALPGAYGSWVLELYSESPAHVIVETLLLIFILFIALLPGKRGGKGGGGIGGGATPNSKRLSAKEQQELLDQWQPEPLVPAGAAPAGAVSVSASAARRGAGAAIPFSSAYVAPDPVVVSGCAGTHVRLEGAGAAGGEKLNFGTFDLLGLSARRELKETARTSLMKFGLGSCGPRGFYGTIDAHLHLEQRIAALYGVEEAIVYSDGASTPSSAIPAFAKRGDLLVVDDGVSDSIRTGLTLSRAQVAFFKHNDVADLERVLLAVRATDRKLKRRSDCQRRFIVVEGLYRNSGTVCPLPAVVALKQAHHFRLIVDESLSFGALGATSGLGVTEHFGMAVDDVDILMGTLGNTAGTVGGFCVGSTFEVVDHQRLSGAGYVFSASAPPFMSNVAVTAIDIMVAEPELRAALVANAAAMHKLLGAVPGLTLLSEPASPILHLVLAQPSSWDAEAALMDEIVAGARAKGVVLVATRYLPEHRPLFRPSVRVTVQATHKQAHLEAGAKALRDAASNALKKLA